MTRKRATVITPSGFEIRVGMSHPFIVVLAGASDYDPVGSYLSLTDALLWYPKAKVTEGAQRKARENGEV